MPHGPFLSGNAGVGPLFALQFWLLIILAQPPARSEYGHLDTLLICCWSSNILINPGCGGVLADIVMLAVTEYVAPAVQPEQLSTALSTGGFVS